MSQNLNTRQILIFMTKASELPLQSHLYQESLVHLNQSLSKE